MTMYDIVLTCNHFTHKLILVTGVDRLEKDLTTGQMQGTLSQIRWEQVWPIKSSLVRISIFGKNSPLFVIR